MWNAWPYTLDRDARCLLEIPSRSRVLQCVFAGLSRFSGFFLRFRGFSFFLRVGFVFSLVFYLSFRGVGSFLRSFC